MIDQFGADALRWLMISSPVMRGQDLSVDPEGKFIRDMVRLAIKPIWNAYNFFTLYANADGVKAEEIYKSDYGMDWYILGECRTAVEIIEQSLDQYDVPKACETSQGFFELLNNVYIRANRDRFWKKSGEVPRLAQALIDRGYTIDTLPEGLREIYTPDYQRGDKIAAYNTLYTVLVTMCKALAPLLPLTTEQIYLGLKGKDCDSVHLQFFPDVSNFERNEEGISEIRRTLDICNAALSIRSAENIRVRQPLRKLTVYSQSWMPEKGMEPGTRSYIENEVNVKEIEFSSDLSGVANFNVKINFPIVGKRLPQKMKQLIAASKQGDWKALPDGRVQVTDEVLEPAEASLTLTPKNPKGAQALSTNDALVILDLEITEELRKEGIARDLVRMIQQARKDANLNITDRITLQVEGDADVITAFDQYKDYIAEQTLASSAAKAAPQGFKAEGEIEGKKITIGLSKAA